GGAAQGGNLLPSNAGTTPPGPSQPARDPAVHPLSLYLREVAVPVPLMDPKSQFDPIEDQILAAVTEVIRTGRYVLGAKVSEAGGRSAGGVRAAHGIGVANGTGAIVIALQALGIERGDEVICPAFTFYATAEAIVQAGAVPVFADIDPATYCLDPEAV